MNKTCYLEDKFIHECSSKLVYELGDFVVDPSISVIGSSIRWINWDGASSSMSALGLSTSLDNF
jgi:hypothetical protein